MIKRFIRRVLGLSTESTVRMPRGKHGLSRDSLSPAAAKVCGVLRDEWIPLVYMKVLRGRDS